MREHKIKFKFMFAWYDLWVGAFIDRSNKALYVFPLPTLGIKIYLVDWAETLTRCPCCVARGRGNPVNDRHYGVDTRLGDEGKHRAVCRNCSHGMGKRYKTKEEAFGAFNKAEDWMHEQELEDK